MSCTHSVSRGPAGRRFRTRQELFDPAGNLAAPASCLAFQLSFGSLGKKKREKLPHADIFSMPIAPAFLKCPIRPPSPPTPASPRCFPEAFSGKSFHPAGAWPAEAANPRRPRRLHARPTPARRKAAAATSRSRQPPAVAATSAWSWWRSCPRIWNQTANPRRPPQWRRRRRGAGGGVAPVAGIKQLTPADPRSGGDVGGGAEPR